MTTAVALPEPRTLFAISDDLQTFFDTLEMVEAQLAEPQTDEDRAALEQSRYELRQSIDTIGAELATKTDAVAGVLRRMSAERDLIESEEHRLRARRKSCERADKWLRDYVVSVMQATDQKQLKTASNTLFLRGSDAVEILDAAKVPAEYQNAEVKLPLTLWHAMRGAVRAIGPPGLMQEVDTVRVHAEPSLSTIKRAIKSGADVPGADLQLRTGLVCR